MHRNLQMCLAATILTQFVLPASTAIAQSSVKRTIRDLGGTIRPFSKNSIGIEVDFRFRGRKLTDKGLAHVGKLDGVVSLDLRDTQITSSGLTHLTTLKQLRWLHLERTKVDDKGIAHLANLVELEYLNLFKTKVTDKSLTYLTKMKKLRSLYVWQTKVTAKGAKKLQEALPNLRIVLGVDLAKLPRKEIKKPAKKPVPIKWVVAEGQKPPRSKLGENISVLFKNARKKKVKLYWVSYGGPLKLYAVLDPGATRRQNSYSKAVWLIKDEEENSLGYFITIPEDVNLAVIPAG